MKNEAFGWEEFCNRTDIIGGTLEVFFEAESEPRPDLDEQYRGVIKRIKWTEDGFPIFCISATRHFDFASGEWLGGGPDIIEFLSIARSDHKRVHESGPYLFIPGLGRYLIIPKGVEVPVKPILKPVSYSELGKKLLESLSAK